MYDYFNMTELVKISIGELWDKYSILLIKKKYINDSISLKMIDLELNFLNTNMEKYSYINNKMFIDLKKINEQLWIIEDKIRKKELNKEFDNEFIKLARNVYIINDKRAICKKNIDIFFGSSIQEVKLYVKYN